MLHKDGYYLLSKPVNGELKSGFSINFKRFTLLTCSLPLSAFLFCIVYSLIYNFKSSTATSCGAYNILPSISAAIGGYSPQKQVWQAVISIDFFPRIILILVYLKYNVDLDSKRSNLFIYILGILNVIENFALLILTYYDSTHYYPTHKFGFVSFLIISQLHMMLLICQQFRIPVSYGLKMKILLTIINIASIILATYYFIDHNVSCEDFAYTKFALLEYIVVLSNIAFHYTIVYDFPNHDLIISKQELIKLEANIYKRIPVSYARKLK